MTGSRRRSSAWAGGRPCIATDLKPSPSVRNRTPNLAPQMRVALTSMELNTGVSSPGELLITPNTSEVAVCCSSDSLKSSVRWRSSLSSRVFSMAMTAWAAKFCDQLDLFVGERPHLLAIDGESRQSVRPP